MPLFHSPACTVFLVGRDDWQRDGPLNLALVDRLARLNIRIVWEEAAPEIAWRRQCVERSYPWLKKLPGRARRSLAQILYAVCHPSYFLRPFYKYHASEECRLQRLRRQLQRLGQQRPLVVLSRSAGGRRVSSIADQAAVDRIICLGYPFRHPDRGDEPERYRHLATLTTPMLIVQGVHDAYGGREITECYALSPAIDVKFVEADHDFDASATELDYVVHVIEATVRRLACERLSGRYLAEGQMP